MLSFIDRAKKYLWLKLGVIYLRYLTGFAFVFASVVKIKGERFTKIPATEPVGYFFEAMYQTGAYWKFLGWSQFIAGALLMSQRFSTIGALVFLPVILNVFMITHAINFGMGTPLITTLMLLSTLFLVLWDYKKWSILFQQDHRIHLDLRQEPEDKFMNDPVWTIAGCTFILLTLMVTLFPAGIHLMWWWFGSMLATGIGACVIGLMRYRRLKPDKNILKGDLQRQQP